MSLLHVAFLAFLHVGMLLVAFSLRHFSEEARNSPKVDSLMVRLADGRLADADGRLADADSPTVQLADGCSLMVRLADGRLADNSSFREKIAAIMKNWGPDQR
uniref:Uncharacterized protein n=1 Tax=Globodera rostochiensis TaxID=31243 RepID=A0A914H4N6_GLORO